LKHGIRGTARHGDGVAPRGGARIETSSGIFLSAHTRVAPRGGARIETTRLGSRCE